MTTSDGHPTSATYGFTLTLRAILNKESPDRIAVAFDGPRERLERTKIYPAYKATREKAPDELIVQLPDVRRVVASGSGGNWRRCDSARTFDSQLDRNVGRLHENRETRGVLFLEHSRPTARSEQGTVSDKTFKPGRKRLALGALLQ